MEAMIKVQITHHDWKIDSMAISHPWGIMITGAGETVGRETPARFEDAGSAGSEANRTVARIKANLPLWMKNVVVRDFEIAEIR